MDWLHCADLGVTADYVGNVFQMLVEQCDALGRSKEKRCAELWRRIQAYYREHGVKDQLQNLSLSMICQEKKAPKLRGSAACVRAIVPCANELAQLLLFDGNPDQRAAKVGMAHLNKCYQALSAASIFSRDILAVNSRKFAAQYVALESFYADSKKWNVKPKLHLFLELCGDGSQPSALDLQGRGFWRHVCAVG